MDALFTASNLTKTFGSGKDAVTAVNDVSFALRRGEILGVTGLLGAGQNELVRALFGIAPGAVGTIRRRGRPVQISSPAEAIAQGICLLTEHRKQEGLFPDLSVKENISLPSLTASSA